MVAWLEALSEDIKSNYKSLIYHFLISLSSSVPLLYISNSKQQLFVTIVCVVFLFSVSFINRFLFITLSSIFLLISTVFFHLVNLWGEDTIKSRIQAAYLSPTYESVEYISNFWGVSDYLLTGYLFVFALLSYLYIYKIRHQIRNIKKLSAFLIILIILLSQKVWFFYDKQPFLFIQALSDAGKWKYFVDKRLAYLEQRKSPLGLKNFNIKYDKIVLLLGESVNREHMGTYGYSKNTTPFLDDLLTKKNTYQFNYTISPANQTRYSIPLMLTDAHVNDFDKFPSSSSIVSSFKDFGFKTYWFSNQYMAGMHDSYIATIASEASEVKIANYVYEQGGKADLNYDQVLIEYLNSTNFNISAKEFYVLHLLGSHFQYNKRYPENYGLFPQPNNKVEAYDNSIKYTDEVLKKVHLFFQDSKTLFIYVADHGQVVELNKSGHGFHNPSFSDEYNVPFLIYSNIDNPRLDDFYNEHKDSLINLENLKAIILHIIDFIPSSPLNNSKVIAIDPINVIDYNSLELYRNTNKD